MGDEQFGKYVEILQATPQKLRSLIQGLGEDQLRFKPTEDSLSLKEHLFHLRDIEIEGYRQRIRLILAEDLPVLHDIDGNRMVQMRRYQMGNATKALEEFCQAREGNMAYLRNMTAFQWNRKALFNGDEITLIDLVGKWVAHDQEHLNAMEELLEKIKAPAA
jgi:DinB family protein